MATGPKYYTAARIGIAALTTGVTAVDGTGATDLLVGGTLGTKVEEVFLKAAGTNVANPADSVIALFLVSNLNTTPVWTMIRQFDIGDPVVGSTTVNTFELVPAATFENLILPDPTWKLAATISVTPTAGNVTVVALGNDA